MWLPRENNFYCINCKAKGGCSDEKGSKEPFFWDENAQKITCVNCSRQLTRRRELEEKVKIKEIHQYGFWLRFMSEHFIPCDKCQEELNEVLTLQHSSFKKGMTLDFSSPLCVSLHAFKSRRDLPEFRFTLSFVSPTQTTSYHFAPCNDCQGKLWHIFSKKELHIGNENKPLVELWRKWEIVDEKN